MRGGHSCVNVAAQIRMVLQMVLKHAAFTVWHVTLSCHTSTSTPAALLQVLERIAGLLEPGGGGITLVERGDCAAVPRHPDFRLLAAMNPATDAGKHDLPAQLRNRWGRGWGRGDGSAGSLIAAVVRMGGMCCTLYTTDVSTPATTRSNAAPASKHAPVWPLVNVLTSASSTSPTWPLHTSLPLPRFTELWVAEPSAREDLAALVRGYLASAAASPPVDAVVDLYLEARELAVRECVWGGGC